MKLLKILPIIILCFVITVFSADARLTYGGSTSILYEMHVNDTPVGIMKSAAQGLKVADELLEDLVAVHGSDSIIDMDIVFKEVKASKTGLSDLDQITSAIGDVLDVKVPACGLIVDDELIFYVKSEEAAKNIINSISEPFVEKVLSSDDTELEDTYFKQAIEYSDEIVSFAKVANTDEALSLLGASSESINAYTVKDGDTLWSIANAHEMDIEDIEAENPEFAEGYIRPGDIINLSAYEPIISVITEEKATLFEDIEYITDIRQNSSLAHGTTKVIQEGEKGSKRTTYLVYRENGRELDREKLEETVEKEAIKKIVERGTRIVHRSSPSTTYRGPVTGNDIVRVAKQQAGKRYKIGTAGPTTFDCSGLVHYVYQTHFGINLNGKRRAKDMAGIGMSVSKGNCKPGDIVLFSADRWSNSITHVGIYVGNNKFIHARGTPNNPKSVQITSLNQGHYKERYRGARRIIQ